MKDHNINAKGYQPIGSLHFNDILIEILADYFLVGSKEGSE